MLKRIKPILFFLLIAYICLYILSLNYKPGPMGLLERTVMETVSPLQKGVHHVFRYVGGLLDEYVNLVGVKKENTQLKEKIAVLQNELNSYRESYLANQRLRKLLGFKRSLPPTWPTVAAELVAWNPTGWYQTITIDKGFLDGVQIGMPVIDAHGVVGKVTALSTHYARVLLLIDPNFAIDCFVQRNRVPGIVGGYSNGMCRMMYVQQNRDVKIGDVIVTSGISGYFPKGLPVGTVKRLKNNRAQLFQEIYVKPFVDFTKLEEVLIILKEKPVFEDAKSSKNK